MYVRTVSLLCIFWGTNFLFSCTQMPVSTTHSCVGGMVGMTIATKGGSCVKWYVAKETFPYVGGVSGIVLSWFISPIMSAIIAGFIFYMTRLLVLRHKNSFKRTLLYLRLTLECLGGVIFTTPKVFRA